MYYIFLYYNLAYIQRNGDVSFENSDFIRKTTYSVTFERGLPAVFIEVTSVSLATFRISVSKYFTNASFQVLICSLFIIFACLSTIYSLCVRKIVK